MDIDLKQLTELMSALKEFGVSELEIKRDGEYIRLERKQPKEQVTVHAAPAPMAHAPMHASVVPMAPPPPAAPTSSAEPANVKYITSPFVGTFYRSPSPDAPAFVEAGQRIEAGQVLCIVEAMKLMNEIEAELAGTVIEVLVENGKPVEYGDRLFKIQT